MEPQFSRARNCPKNQISKSSKNDSYRLAVVHHRQAAQQEPIKN